MLSILLAEDDKEINDLVLSYLELEGYRVFSVNNGQDAFDVFLKEKIDIVLSDIMMPICDGNKLAKSIREINKTVPIIFMSAKDDKISKQIGYKLGIDDYITKPFDIDELVFKIKAISRRIDVFVSGSLSVGNLVMNIDERTAYVGDDELGLSVKEFDILYKMLSYPKKIFTRSNLMEEFWGFDSSATSRTVDVYLSKLREKTRNCDGFEIKTIHGLGYKVVLK